MRFLEAYMYIGIKKIKIQTENPCVICLKIKQKNNLRQSMQYGRFKKSNHSILKNNPIRLKNDCVYVKQHLF